MGKTGVGTVLLLSGVIGLVLVYSMRPPSGIMDAFAMMAQGRQTFIKEPFYQVLIALAGIVTFFGALLVYLGLSQRLGQTPVGGLQSQQPEAYEPKAETPKQPSELPQHQSKVPTRHLTYALLAVSLVLIVGGSYWGYHKWLPNSGEPTSTATGIKYFHGGWENIDSATQGLTRLDIRVSDRTAFLHAWGKCLPTDCDWGEVKAEAYTQDVSSDVKADARLLGAIFKTNFNETTLVTRAELGDRLRLESATRFTDQSGRSSYSAVYVFRRAR